MADDLTDLDLPAADAILIWHDLESALAGKNGYGGDVAEIYAYRLVPPPLWHHPQDEAQARIAGKNMTRILRRFVELHEGAVISTQEARDGFKPIDLAQEFPPFDWRVHLRVTRRLAQPPLASTQRARAAIAEFAEHSEALIAMLDELSAFRANERLRVGDVPSASTDDLPPDAATGLYLDRPFDAEDLVWIRMAWDGRLSRSDGLAKRPTQIMLVFEAIERDARATQEFLRVMNTSVLPFLRRLRLKEQPHLTKLGAISE